MKNILVSLITLFVVILSGYFSYQYFTTFTVSELNTKALKYDRKIVKVRGVVETNMGFMGVGGYLLGDGKSSVLVTTSEGLPQKNARLTITGQFRRAVSLNGLEYNVVKLGIE